MPAGWSRPFARTPGCASPDEAVRTGPVPVRWGVLEDPGLPRSVRRQATGMHLKTGLELTVEGIPVLSITLKLYWNRS